MAPSAPHRKSRPHQRRRFAQARARRTYEALLSAGEAVLVERGFDATQTPDIAARAGVSVGTFYRYFTDKKEILLEVLHANLSSGQEEVMSGLTPESLSLVERREAIERALAILLQRVTRKPKLQRLFQEMSLRDDDVAALRRSFDRQALDWLAALIGEVCSREDVPDPEATALVIQTSVVESALAISGGGRPRGITRERSLRALAELVYRALFGIDRSRR